MGQPRTLMLSATKSQRVIILRGGNLLSLEALVQAFPVSLHLDLRTLRVIQQSGTQRGKSLKEGNRARTPSMSAEGLQEASRGKFLLKGR